MSTPPAGISAADWHSTPESVRDLVAQLQLLKQENEQLRPQRCRVHFAKNLLQRVPKAHQGMVTAALRSVYGDD